MFLTRSWFNLPRSLVWSNYVIITSHRQRHSRIIKKFIKRSDINSHNDRCLRFARFQQLHTLTFWLISDVHSTLGVRRACTESSRCGSSISLVFAYDKRVSWFSFSVGNRTRLRGKRDRKTRAPHLSSWGRRRRRRRRRRDDVRPQHWFSTSQKMWSEKVTMIREKIRVTRPIKPASVRVKRRSRKPTPQNFPSSMTYTILPVY